MMFEAPTDRHARRFAHALGRRAAARAPRAWRNAVRIIPSVFPPIDLFERVARPEHLDAVHAIESAFNPRLRDAVGDLSLVPRDERIVGPGAGYIMAAFTHVSPDGQPVQQRHLRRVLRRAARSDGDRRDALSSRAIHARDERGARGARHARALA